MVTAQPGATREDENVRDRLTRALRPFRFGQYRLLAVALTLSLFGAGVWLIAVVFQIRATGGGPLEVSFVATANAVSHAGAQPYFVDSDEETLGLSVDAVAEVLRAARSTPDGPVNAVTGRRIGAIVPMHTLGHPMRVAELVALAAEYDVPVVEDAAESLGSRVDGVHTGTSGRLGILSFNGNKILTTGGGGMILTDDDELAIATSGEPSA